MGVTFRCSHGHEWSADRETTTGFVSKSDCPVCGPQGETISGGTMSSTEGAAGDRFRADLPEIEGYELLRVIGKGGMGVVYHAKHQALSREVAIKVVLAGDHALPEDLIRFLAEAEIVARLKHPHIVSVYDLGNTKGRPFFSMEFVPGGNLRRSEAAELLLKLARATEHAQKNPPLMILDEGTSALDNISERRVQQAIAQARADRTVIMVAHRLSTLRDADRIFVFDNGRIVEVGPYDELVERDGVFTRLVRSAEAEHA